MNYYDLSIAFRALLMALLFISANSAIVLLIRIFRRHLCLHAKIILPVLFLINTFFCVIFAIEARGQKFSRQLPEFITNICKRPIFICILILILSICYIAFIYISDLRFRKNNLSQTSIKESLDKLPTGLCFYYENGKIVLVNSTMNNLCHKIIGKDLQNAKLFWEMLEKGNVLPEIKQIEKENQQSYRLLDGKVWTFSKTKLNEMMQIVAIESTELSDINQELKQSITELSNINARLREYGDQVDDLTRTRERIDIKAGIHRELGQALLLTKKYILDNSNNSDALIYIWKKNIEMLTNESYLSNDETLLSELLESARNSGVTIKITGELPKNKKQYNLCIIAAIECLVNGVRHADANTIYITIKENKNEIFITYENDGKLPNSDIIEGGGLSSLRYRANRLGGKLTVEAKPRYSLTIILPKEGGNL